MKRDHTSSLAFVFLLVIIFLTNSGCSGCSGGSSSSNDSEVVGYGDIVGGVALENLTTSASFDSNANLTARRTSSTQAYIQVNDSKSQYLTGKPAMAFLTDTAVSGEATLYDLNDEPVGTTDILSGEYQFSGIANGTYKLVLTLATPADFKGMTLTTYVDVTANSTITPRPSPLSDISVAAATYIGNQFGITGDLLGKAGVADMIQTVQNCYETQGELGIEDEIQVSDLRDSSGLKLSLENLKSQFDSLPPACKNLGDTSFAKFKLLAAGDDPVKITQAVCEILSKSGFIVALNDPEFSFCHPSYEGGGSPFTADQITENYCPNPEGDCEDEYGSWSYPFAVVPTLLERDRNRTDDEPDHWLPTIDEYRIISMSVAQSKGVTVTPKEIYGAMVDSDGLGLRLCFDSGRSSEYCIGKDGTPVINQVWGEENNEGPQLTADDTQAPTCHEILPIFCNEGESIDSFAQKNINMDVVKEGIVFRRLHVPWNNTGGPEEWVVFDGDAWRQNSTASAVKVNVVRNDKYEIASVAQATNGKYYLGFTEKTESDGEVRFVHAESGLEMEDSTGRFQRWDLDDIGFLAGVNVRESGTQIYGGPSIDINGFNYGVLYDGWQAGAKPIEVCVTYTTNYTVAQNEDGTCSDSVHYLTWTEGTQEDEVAELISATSGDCALEDPAARQSESNSCVKWSLTQIVGLQSFEYKDNFTHVFGGDVANPRFKEEKNPFFDDFPENLCNIDADGDGYQDDGDGIWCSETVYNSELCDEVEPTFSWRSFLSNPEAPYSVDNNFYRWRAEKNYVFWNDGDPVDEFIACGENFDRDKMPPHPDDSNNILEDNTKGDSFDFLKTPSENGLTQRNFKARYNAYAVGRPNAALNMAALAFGNKFVLGPDTPFQVIDAFALIYLSWGGVETNVIVPEITIEDWGYDPETQQEVDFTFFDEIFHARFYMPRHDNYDDFQTIMKKFGIPREVYEESDIWSNFEDDDDDDDEDFHP